MIINNLQEDADQVAKNLQGFTQRQETFRQELIGHVGKLFDTFSLGVVSLDALMSLFFDMYGHVDAGMRELVRNKLATLFKPHLIGSVQGKNISRQERDTAEAGGWGYLGGDEVVRDRLEKQIKTDDLLNKAVDKFKPRFSRGGQQDRDRDKRGEGYQDSEKQKGIFCIFFCRLSSSVDLFSGGNADRSRSPHQRQNKAGGSSSTSTSKKYNRAGKNSGGGGNNNSANGSGNNNGGAKGGAGRNRARNWKKGNDDNNKKSKSEFTSPDSFESAWEGSFSTRRF